MSVNGGLASCLRRGIRFQRYVKYKAKCEANFGGGEKQIRFRGKVEGREAGVLVAKGRATLLLDARLRGKDGMSAGSCHRKARIARGASGREGGDVRERWDIRESGHMGKGRSDG